MILVKRRPHCVSSTPDRDGDEEKLPQHSEVFTMPFRNATQLEAIRNERSRYSSPNSPFRRRVSISYFRESASKALLLMPQKRDQAVFQRAGFVRSGGIERGDFFLRTAWQVIFVAVAWV